MSMLPKISIVTPSFNQGQFLDETLRSVISQREHVHEYFVLDGGSTDNSVDVIKKHAGAIDWWVSEKDKGQSDALNKGFARATGDYLLWINSDDVLLPGALSRVREALAADPRLDVISGWFVQIDANSRITGAVRMPAESNRRISSGVLRVGQPTVYFRRAMYEKVGAFRDDLHCVFDTELWMRYVQAGAKWGINRAYNAAFRIHAASKGGSWLEKYRREETVLDQMYPRMRVRRLGFFAARYGYKLAQYLSLRDLKARRDARRWRGKTVEEVFGAAS